MAVISIGMVAAYLALPIIALFFHSNPELFFSSLTEPKVIDALMLSLVTSTIAMVVIVLVGTPAAYFHSRMDYHLVRGAPRRLTNQEKSWHKIAPHPRRRGHTKGKSCSLLVSL